MFWNHQLTALSPIQVLAARAALSDEGARLWVYGRQGRPCHRCGTAILTRKQGTGARSTYWCPECQSMTEDGGDIKSGDAQLAH
jgi:formamidopyrimidine-DNA glycosylase